MGVATTNWGSKQENYISKNGAKYFASTILSLKYAASKRDCRCSLRSKDLTFVGSGEVSTLAPSDQKPDLSGKIQSFVLGKYNLDKNKLCFCCKQNKTFVSQGNLCFTTYTTDTG